MDRIFYKRTNDGPWLAAPLRQAPAGVTYESAVPATSRPPYDPENKATVGQTLRWAQAKAWERAANQIHLHDWLCVCGARHKLNGDGLLLLAVEALERGRRTVLTPH